MELPAGRPADAPPLLPATPEEREGLLDALFESAAVGLALCSPDGRIIRANRALASLLHSSAERLVGRGALELTHPEGREAAAALLRQLSDRRRSHIEVDTRYLLDDGSAVWARVTIVAAYGADGAPSHHLVTIRDLSAKRALAARLEEANARYRTLVDANIIGVAVATTDGITEANDEFLRLAGATREAFESHGVDWRAITPPEYGAREEEGLRQVADRGACIPFEKEYLWPDGTRVPILVGAARLEREPLKWIAFALDLSERKHAESERDRLLEEARTARTMAELALHARETVLAQVTHDLRSPVAANIGYESLMRDGLPVPLHPTHHAYVLRMIANHQHLLALMDSLLDFARSSSGRAAVELETLDVDALLAAVEPVVAPQLQDAGLEFDCPACDSPLTVRADPLKAKQILVNLLANAIKFTPDGGRITLRAAAHGDRVAISVTDTGIGVAPELQERIFEPFVQSRSLDANGHRKQGFGLGLAISRQLAHAMDGDVTVRSDVGAGSTFTLTLPRASSSRGE